MSSCDQEVWLFIGWEGGATKVLSPKLPCVWGCTH